MRAVFAGSRDEGLKAKQEVRETGNWRRVVAQYSTVDALEQVRHPEQLVVNREEVKGAVRAAIFGAPFKQVLGPLKVPQGWLVYEALTESPKRQRSFRDMAILIQHLLVSRQQERDLLRLNRHLEDKYRQESVCAEDYKSPLCRNVRKSGS